MEQIARNIGCYLQQESPRSIVEQDLLKGHCIEFKYYADGIHSGLTPPG